MGEEQLVLVGCSLSGDWVLCLLCALSFNIILARRKDGSSRTVCGEQAESGAGALIRGASPEG